MIEILDIKQYICNVFYLCTYKMTQRPLFLHLPFLSSPLFERKLVPFSYSYILESSAWFYVCTEVNPRKKRNNFKQKNGRKSIYFESEKGVARKQKHPQQKRHFVKVLNTFAEELKDAFLLRFTDLSFSFSCSAHSAVFCLVFIQKNMLRLREMWMQMFSGHWSVLKG